MAALVDLTADIPDPRSVPLSNERINAYCLPVHEGKVLAVNILSIHLQQISPTEVEVVAKCEAHSTNQRSYTVRVIVHPNGQHIESASCTCPVGSTCKHVCKVLRRITTHVPINHQYLSDMRKKRRLEIAAQRCSVYIVFHCYAERDDGDWNHSVYRRDSYDAKVLGVFFGLRTANAFARDHIVDNYDDEVEEEGEDLEPLFWSNSETTYEEDSFDKVWVEKQAVQDASAVFHA